ncbi:MAG: penicillin-insensitive murein endopeptidase, partial [Bdellovibrionota bacterium]
ITTALPGDPGVIGNYSFGCLKGAQALPPDGDGFQVMRITRRRFYGHPLLIQFIEDLAARASKLGFDDLLIGDLGQPRGGPMPSGHRSHQIGLDVDVWFWAPPEVRARSLTLDERENLSARSTISPDGDHLNPTVWSMAKVKLLKLAAERPEVDRIFVNPVIKREICVQHQGEPWVAHLRPWYGHDDHFHIRLKCPAAQPDCFGKEDPIPPGDGCDQTLNWWFSEEAKHPAPAPKAKARGPLVPDACQDLLPNT